MLKVFTVNGLDWLDWLEVYSKGDYSFITGAGRKSVIKHNGGYFYCFADKYDYYKSELATSNLCQR